MKTAAHRSTLGEAATLLLAGMALVTLAGWLGPKILPGTFDRRTREAEQSQDASAQVEQAVAKAVQAEQAKGAVVAASNVQIGIAAGQLPDSPQRTFIVRESAWVSPLLPPPDPAALLAAERRRVAIMEGKVELADRLYRDAAKDNAALLARAAKAEARAEAAFSARREADTALVESAAYARGKDAVIGLLAAVAVLCVVLWLYARVHANRLGGFVRKVIPALDSAYENAPQEAKQTLDATVFDRLSKAMDAAEKKLVHAIRAKL